MDKFVRGSLNKGASGKIATPGFNDDGYSNNTDCFYIIKTAPDLKIKLKFKFIDMEPGPPTCPFDFLQVYNKIDGSVYNNERYCGLDTPGAIYSEENYIKIEFHSDEEYTGKGAAFKFEIYKEEVDKVFICDFETDGLCGLEIVEGGDHLHHQHGSSTTSGTGPKFDHTYQVAGKGRYLLFDSSGLSGTVQSIFQTPEIYMYVSIFLTDMKDSQNNFKKQANYNSLLCIILSLS